MTVSHTQLGPASLRFAASRRYRDHRIIQLIDKHDLARVCRQFLSKLRRIFLRKKNPANIVQLEHPAPKQSPLPFCIVLLFVFVGCAAILGIEEGVLVDPPAPIPPLTFTYVADLPGTPPQGKNVRAIGWLFTTLDLEYPEGGGLPMGFNPGPHQRGQPTPTPVLAAGETVNHGSLGDPSGGSLTCECWVWLEGDGEPSIMRNVSKSPGDVDFPEFQLSQDFVLT